MSESHVDFSMLNSWKCWPSSILKRFYVSLICLTVFVCITVCDSQSTDAQRLRKKEVSAEEVRQSIAAGVRAMKEMQNGDGSWDDYRFTGDTTALCALALLNAEDNPNDPQIQRAIDHLTNRLGNKIDKTYVVSLRIMVLAMADPDGQRYMRAVQNDVQWLVKNQTKSGGWNYMDRSSGRPDSSNSQFALLALHEANLMGATIPDEVWVGAQNYWESCLNNRGGFSYSPGGGGASGSMTAAGLSSWIIIEENLADVEELFAGDRAKCCSADSENDPVKMATQFLADHFSVRGNPRHPTGKGAQLYWLYGLERAGRLAGQRFFGPHDWYRSGSAQLVHQQTAGVWRGHSHGESNKIVATSLALLFLSKGKRPVAIGKYRYKRSEDWNLHPKGVHYLSRNLEEIWDKKLNWQTVDGTNATVDDLLETPVLFMSGHDAFDLSEKQKETLKKYLENGGFLFAEACQGDGCGRAPFDESFRDLMAEMFPDSDLEPLQRDHPIWTAHYPLVKHGAMIDDRPVLGLQACCRTSVVYCPANLSCYWSLNRPVVQKYLSKNAGVAKFAKISERIDYCAKLGSNVVTYATGRELRDKGDTPKLDESEMVSVLANRSLDMPKLMHDGGSDEAPNAWRNVLKEVQKVIKVELKKKMVPVESEALSDYPFVFMHGRSGFEFTAEQRDDLKSYLQSGGFLFADSICSSAEFTESFRREMEIIFEQPLNEIPPTHEIWSSKFGYSIDKVTLRKKDPIAQGGFREIVGPPEMEGHEFDGRLVVVFSPNDISCAVENRIKSQCEGYLREDAVKFGVNVILYRQRGD
jgi:hypothetical protein